MKNVDEHLGHSVKMFQEMELDVGTVSMISPVYSLDRRYKSKWRVPYSGTYIRPSMVIPSSILTSEHICVLNRF